jgi:hypothetical protein
MTALPSIAHRSRRAVWLLSAVIVVLVGGLALAMIGGPANPLPLARKITGSAHGGIAKANRPTLIVHGSSPAFLAPGVTKRVTIRIRNPHHTPLTITSAWIRVGNASPTCTAKKNIRTASYHSKARGAAKYDVYLHHRVRIPLTLTMLDLPTNQDACKGARFPLSYRVTGRKG